MALQASSPGAQEACLPPEPRLALAAAAALALALWAAKGVAGVPVVGPAALTAVVFAQLWWPVARCDHHLRPLSAVGLGGRSGVARELAQAAALLAVVLPLYGWAAAWWWGGGGPRLAVWAQSQGLGRWGGAGALAGGWRLASPPPPASWAWGALAAEGAGQVLGVALPEEVFFRGYLLPQLRLLWPPAGGPAREVAGRAAGLTALMFATGHWLGEWHPGRLLTFFPGLLFGAVACRQRSLAGAIALHAGCNLFARGLAACLQPAGAA